MPPSSQSLLVGVGSRVEDSFNGLLLGHRADYTRRGAERCVTCTSPRALPVRIALCASPSVLCRDGRSALRGPACEPVACPHIPPDIPERESHHDFWGLPTLHVPFSCAGKRKNTENEENGGQSAPIAKKSTVPLDVPYPFGMLCTADKEGGVAPAWEIALYALILLATDAVSRVAGKRSRGGDTAPSSCPFTTALRGAELSEKVCYLSNFWFAMVAMGWLFVQTLSCIGCYWVVQTLGGVVRSCGVFPAPHGWVQTLTWNGDRHRGG